MRIFLFSGGGAVAAPAYISATNLYMAHSVKRIVSGYAGNLFRLVRASDSATMDVPAAASSDRPDYAAINTWIGVSSAKYDIIYDQTGNGHNLVQVTDASRPTYNSSVSQNGSVAACFDGYSTGTTRARSMSVASLTLDRSAMSVFQVLHPQVSLQNNVHWEFRVGATNRFNCFTQYATNGKLTAYDSATAVDAGLMPRAQPSVIGVTSDVGALTFFLREQIVAAAAFATFALNTMVVGISATGGATFNAENRFYGMAVYNAALSSGNATTLRDALTSAFAIPTTFTSRIVWAGDSIMQGYGTDYGRNTPDLSGPFTGTPEIFNTGIYGERLVTQAYPNRVANRDALFTSAYGAGKCLLVHEYGTNDLNNSVSSATLYSGASGVGVYTTSAQSAGFKVVQATILPCTDPSFSGSDETNRIAFNNLVRANSAGADVIVDVASNATMGPLTAPNDTTLYFDLTHPTSLGDSYLAVDYTTGVSGLL